MSVSDEVKEYYEAIVPSHCNVSDEVREAMEYAIQFTLKRHRDILSNDACERECVLTKG